MTIPLFIYNILIYQKYIIDLLLFYQNSLFKLYEKIKKINTIINNNYFISKYSRLIFLNSLCILKCLGTFRPIPTRNEYQTYLIYFLVYYLFLHLLISIKFTNYILLMKHLFELSSSLFSFLHFKFIKSSQLIFWSI